MANLFNSIQVKKPNRNVFDLSHDVKLSLDMGNLVPIMVMDCIPGDKVSIGTESLIRFAPLVSPMMHRVNVFMHYFFVPNRILWDNWEKWIVSNDSVERPVFPKLRGKQHDAAFEPGSLSDYLGMPTLNADAAIQHYNAMAFAAYQCVYNEYYRDQNLVSEVDYKLDDGLMDFSGTITPKMADFVKLRKRAWMHDYFTSALPWAQKGGAVELPLGDVYLDPDTTNRQYMVDHTTHDPVGTTGALSAEAGFGIIMQGLSNDVVLDPNGTLKSGSTTVNELRRAMALQKWLELNARAGTRYTENIYANFGVKSPDSRLQRPEYITGSKSQVVVSEVLNTTGSFNAADDAPTSRPQGDMAGHGVSVTSGKQGSYYATEHGYIIGIMSIMPVTAYQDTIPKHFLKFDDPFQYYWPAFANIGEQPIYRKEISRLGLTETEMNEEFGYTPRYAEYKYMPSRVAGQFKTTLAHWHLGRIFENSPLLNQSFVECDPSKRVFAVTDESEHSVFAHVLNRVTAVRSMPRFGTPML